MYPRLLQPPSTPEFFSFRAARGGENGLAAPAAPPCAVFRPARSSSLYATARRTRAARRADSAGHKDWVVIDEVQRAPELLNEVHRLIESRKLRFGLTGSSARKLRRKGVNLLAGRAVTRHMHPLTALELGKDFDLKRTLRYGCLPLACTTNKPQDYLKSYAATYLREEVQQEGICSQYRRVQPIPRSREFSQGSVLNMTAVARECCGVSESRGGLFQHSRGPAHRRATCRFFQGAPSGAWLPTLKFYYFDAGVFQTIRPRGPLDAPDQIHGPALETLFLQQAAR